MNQKKQWVQGTAWPSTGIAVDSTAAISLASNAQVTAKNKHIDLKYHHVRELMRTNTVHLFYVRSEDQPEYILTKIVSFDTYSRLCVLRSMRSD